MKCQPCPLLNPRVGEWGKGGKTIFNSSPLSLLTVHSLILNQRSPQAMEDLEALCKKLSFLSTKNQLKWNGSKNDLLRFLALHLEVQPNQFRANDNGTCAVFKIQNITCNFYHKAKTLQIQGKEDADKLRKDLINLTSAWAHPEHLVISDKY